MLYFPIIFLGVLLALAFAGFRVLAEYERGVVFRLGRFNGVRTAGLKWIIPCASSISIRREIAGLLSSSISPAQPLIVRQDQGENQSVFERRNRAGSRSQCKPTR